MGEERDSPTARRARDLEPIRPAPRPKPAALIALIRSHATGVRLDAGVAEPSIRELIHPLTEALDLAADVLEQQQRLLIDLHNHKADAT